MSKGRGRPTIDCVTKLLLYKHKARHNLNKLNARTPENIINNPYVQRKAENGLIVVVYLSGVYVDSLERK